MTGSEKQPASSTQTNESQTAGKKKGAETDGMIKGCEVHKQGLPLTGKPFVMGTSMLKMTTLARSRDVVGIGCAGSQSMLPATSMGADLGRHKSV